MTNTTLSSGVQPLNPATAHTIPWTKLQNPSSSTYHYQGWVYIKNQPSGVKTILTRGTDILKLNGTTLTFAYDNSGSKEIEITTDFPLQKWVYIVVNVVNGKIVEVYLNGKLVLTKQVTLTIPGTKSDLTYGQTSSGIEGYITKVKRDPVALTPDEAWKTYLEGNGLATFSNFLAGYNASFSLYNTEGTIKQYTAL
jgi:hypothetical protein